LEDYRTCEFPAANEYSRFIWLVLLVLITVAAQGQPTAPNDTISNRLDLQLSQVVTGTFAGADKQADEPDILGDWQSGFQTQHPVWWNWTATVNTSVCLVVTMPGTRPLLEVFQGDSPNPRQQAGTLTFQDPVLSNGTNFYATQVRFDATAGSNYLIAVDSQVPLSIAWDTNA